MAGFERCVVIRSEKLERFILGFGLEMPTDGFGRPTNLPALLFEAQEKCGDCTMEELVDALYNLGDEHAELLEFLPNGRPAYFSKHRNHPRWRNFFNGPFNIKVLPKGRVRFEKLSEQDDHTFPRRAIDEARKSIAEPDGKPHPKVGAVIVKDGRVVATGYRGEHPANHAEYIALEQKLPEEVVAGSTVYTTLEPCTTRTHPKIPCAERLIERRVKRVCIGMLDPNPVIRGRGVLKLRAAGIIVQLFPDDLQAEVEELNREWSRQYGPANVRAASGGEPNLQFLPLRYGKIGLEDDLWTRRGYTEKAWTHRVWSLPIRNEPHPEKPSEVVEISAQVIFSVGNDEVADSSPAAWENERSSIVKIPVGVSKEVILLAGSDGGLWQTVTNHRIDNLWTGIRPIELNLLPLKRNGRIEVRLLRNGYISKTGYYKWRTNESFDALYVEPVS